MARQLGKSYLLRELMSVADPSGRTRFGEPQDVLHTGKDFGGLQGDAAAGQVSGRRPSPDMYKVREVNGQEEIELSAGR